MPARAIPNSRRRRSSPPRSVPAARSPTRRICSTIENQDGRERTTGSASRLALAATSTLSGGVTVMNGSTEAAPDVTTVREGFGIDGARLETWMADHVVGFTGPLSIAQFSGGQSNPTYRLETPTHRYVLRRKPPGQLLKGAHAVDREARVQMALRAGQLPGRAYPWPVHRRERDRHLVLRHGHGRRPHRLGCHLPRRGARRSRPPISTR